MQGNVSNRLEAATEMMRGARNMGLPTHWKAPMAVCREIPPATTLFFQGNSAHEVLFIEQGLVKLSRMNIDGQEMIIGLRSKGSLLGAAPVIVQEMHTATAITITRCTLRCFPADVFVRLAKTDGDFGWYLQQAHSLEVHQQVSHVAILRCRSARLRFEHWLLQFLSSLSPQEKQPPMRLRLPLKQWEIAQLIGITPEHLSRVLKQIKEEGVIKEENGYMIISDINKLNCLEM